MTLAVARAFSGAWFRSSDSLGASPQAVFFSRLGPGIDYSGGIPCPPDRGRWVRLQIDATHYDAYTRARAEVLKLALAWFERQLKT